MYLQVWEDGSSKKKSVSGRANKQGIHLPNKVVVMFMSW